jgi:hypothetical protein
MLASQVRHRSILLFALALPLFLAACAHQAVAPGGTKESFVCQDQTVGVDTVDGTSPKDVYLCKGYTVTWLLNGNSFTVHFPKKYPFEGAPQDFTNNPQKPNDSVKSPPAKYAGTLVVYHYDMTVNGKPVPDPQIVGGGY